MPKSLKVSLLQFYEYCVANSLPFAFYRLPQADRVKIVAQTNARLQKAAFGAKSVTQSGFLFAPFQEDKHAVKMLIRPDVLCSEGNLPALDFATSTTPKEEKHSKHKIKETSRRQYEALVKKIQKRIKAGSFSKVIAARVVKKQKPEPFNSVTLFKDLCKAYPDAFVSLVCTKEYGLWIGASPEVLLTVSKKQFTTYALAGTKANSEANKKAAWGAKEKEEHVIVSKYILDILKPVIKAKPVVQGPLTVAAGNLLHLRTTIRYNNISNKLWQKAVAALHPTPAIAGLPRKQAIDFISKNEKSARSYYSGYLGPVNIDKEINIFVNLRCMRVLKNNLAIYVGCGITGNSVPAMEWKESEIKSQTLLKVIALNK